MKKIFKVLIASAAILTTACTDLDLLPANGDVDNVTFRSEGAYRSYLAKIYAAFSLTGRQGPSGLPDITLVNDEGFTSYIRAYWKAQELTTDEAVIAWTDAGIRDLHDHSWSSENQFARVLYYRLFLIISLANDFLDQSSNSLLDDRGIPQADRPKIATYRAEARYLRALAYWHALDLFRNVVLYKTSTSALQEQSSPKEIFDFIIEELTAIEPELVAPQQNEYGRADRAAAWMLRAKVNLNAEVYVGEDHYDEVVADCNQIIGAGYTLAPNYQHLFLADNHRFGDGSGPAREFIFTLPADGIQSQSWGSTTFLVSAALGGRMTDNLSDIDNSTAQADETLTNYGVTGGWVGLRTTSAMVSKFSGSTIPTPLDPRAIFYTNGQSLEITDIATFAEGYAVPKFKNRTSTGAAGQNVTHADIDYPMFRLADVYLMYTEAVLRGGEGGNLSTAASYINALRVRAYGNSSANITDGQLSLDFVLDERVRELYFEGTRRIDLIRFKKFSGPGQVVWPWKGGVAQGKETESYLQIFPIPATDLTANPLLDQNDGY
ncbi:MAG: RagB/SusD family nutrient uptake outer membrane protein [Cytophagia bacterium]|nr:RagB/SusD family nutrient uptake outer membrane protein [Cytophagia bacterium]